MTDTKRFSDLPKVPAFPDTELVNLQEILGKDIVIEDYMLDEGKYGQSVVIKFHYPDKEELYSTITWSQVILKKIKRADELNLLPLTGKIEKVKNYYDIN